MINTIIVSGKVFHREEYKGDFDNLILKNLDNKKIENYAKSEFDLIDECDCEEKEIYEFKDEEITWEAERRGYIVFETPSIVDAMRVEQIKEALSY